MAVSQDVTETSRPGPGEARLRFSAVGDEASPGEALRRVSALESAENRARRVFRRSAQIEAFCRVLAIASFLAVAVAAPLGWFLAHMKVTGGASGFRLFDYYGAWALAFAIIVPAMLVLFGRIVVTMSHYVNAAEQHAAAAQKLVEPDSAAIRSVETVGAAVRSQMDALNAGIDDSLIRLASVEAMIRQHVGAIEHAGLAIENRASGAVSRVAEERARLIDLTETLNARADDFATAIAEKAQANILSLQNATGAVGDAESRLEERLTRLETAAMRALQSFDALSTAAC
ncbi:MAG: hypothetical protein U5J99_10140 [Parvularculaceae bacterium]|nr:hypothetical protein [Parvularculaceae bacterium]